MIGETLSHFQITAKQGEGGMAEVYRAEDTKLGRAVAIKVLPPAFTEDAERRIHVIVGWAEQTSWAPSPDRRDGRPALEPDR